MSFVAHDGQVADSILSFPSDWTVMGDPNVARWSSSKLAYRFLPYTLVWQFRIFTPFTRASQDLSMPDLLQKSRTHQFYNNLSFHREEMFVNEWYMKIGGVFFSVKRRFFITLVVGFHYLSPLLESLGMSHILYICGYKSAHVDSFIIHQKSYTFLIWSMHIKELTTRI